MPVAPGPPAAPPVVVRVVPIVRMVPVVPVVRTGRHAERRQSEGQGLTRICPPPWPGMIFLAMSERRYSENEVATIFERAAESEPGSGRQPARTGGMTLAELQEIGREVGMSPEAVARAARSLEASPHPTSRRFLGLPIGVGRTVELGRALTEEEWERLVVDLRETFDARGRIRSEGSFREWTNGNLQALVEPTAGGHRLRLRTLKGSSRSLMTAGLGVLAVGFATALGTALTGGLSGALTGTSFLFVFGAGMIGVGALQLPAWARERRAQMEGIAARWALATRERSDGDPPLLED